MKIKYVTGIVLAIGLMGCQRNTENFDATGTFEATEVIVSAEASGKLIHFRADEGVQLTCGEEVGLIDTVQLHLQKMQLLANRKSVDTQRQMPPTGSNGMIGMRKSPCSTNNWRHNSRLCKRVRQV